LAHLVGVERPAALRFLTVPLALAALAGSVAGCGSSSSSSSTSGTTATSKTAQTATIAATKPSCGSSSASAGTSEAASTATGDIPDNQQFLTFRNRSGGYSISYPEGWARSSKSGTVTFQDKSNTITIKVAQGSKPTTASVASELKQEAASDPCLSAGSPQATTAGPNQVIKATYTTEGQKSSVTGQQPKITVDRYVYFKGGKVATVDLATPVGVDNVDAYRMISESFRWS
jgi:hypothetical protein